MEDNPTRPVAVHRVLDRATGVWQRSKGGTTLQVTRPCIYASPAPAARRIFLVSAILMFNSRSVPAALCGFLVPIQFPEKVWVL